MDFTNLIIISILFVLLNFFCVKYNLLVDRVDNSGHKKFINQKDNIPITGGIYLFSCYLLAGTYIYNSFEIYFFGIILILGYFSDILKNFYPSLRLLLQIILLTIFLLQFDLIIKDVRIEKINLILETKIFAYIFTVFCLAVLINGSNFIDGVNILSIGYYLLITLCLTFLTSQTELVINQNLIEMFSLVLIFLLVLNLMNKVFLGDSGIYFLSLIIAIILIKFNNDNIIISPYYIICLLWYPCFENLFSIIRKSMSNSDPQKPDNMHLHHLLYKNLKFLKSKLVRNNVCGFIILVFNLPLLLLATNYYNYTKYLLIIILISTFLYIYFYFYLRNRIEKKNL